MKHNTIALSALLAALCIHNAHAMLSNSHFAQTARRTFHTTLQTASALRDANRDQEAILVTYHEICAKLHRSKQGPSIAPFCAKYDQDAVLAMYHEINKHKSPDSFLDGATKKVYLLNGKVIGFIQYTTKDIEDDLGNKINLRTADIKDIIVAENSQNDGVGMALISNMLLDCTSRDVDIVTFFTNLSMAPFMSKVGFQIRSCTKNGQTLFYKELLSKQQYEINDY
jgi:ribosomal protein S18 acetylase RimI-like enzyme